jgi:hypothetical protein
MHDLEDAGGQLGGQMYLVEQARPNPEADVVRYWHIPDLFLAVKVRYGSNVPRSKARREGLESAVLRHSRTWRLSAESAPHRTFAVRPVLAKIYKLQEAGISALTATTL